MDELTERASKEEGASAAERLRKSASDPVLPSYLEYSLGIIRKNE